MLTSRARRRVRTTKASDSDLVRRRKVVEAFFAASRDGDFQALLNLLDPDVTARADAAAAAHRVPVEVRGADAVARQALAFSSRAAYARVALIDGEPAIVVASGGRVALVLLVTVTTKGKILDIDIVANPYRLARLKPATDQ